MLKLQNIGRQQSLSRLWEFGSSSTLRSSARSLMGAWEQGPFLVVSCFSIIADTVEASSFHSRASLLLRCGFGFTCRAETVKGQWEGVHALYAFGQVIWFIWMTMLPLSTPSTLLHGTLMYSNSRNWKVHEQGFTLLGFRTECMQTVVPELLKMYTLVSCSKFH